MPTNTTVTVNAGRTTLLFASGKATSKHLVGEKDAPEQRRTKLRMLDELYDYWVDSTYDEKKSPNFMNGHLFGYIDGYSGSLFFINDGDEPQIVLAHVFEDHFDDEYDSSSHSYVKKAKKSGFEAAKAYRDERFEAKGGVKEYLTHFGLANCKVWYVRYKNGHTYP